MNLRDLDLARRLAAVPGIWRAGMVTEQGHIVSINTAAGCALVVSEPHFPERVSWAWVALATLGAPDLDDAATRGALLDVAREVWDDPELHAIPWEHTRHPQGGYRLTAWAVVPSGFDPNDPDDPSVEPISTGPTEGAALADAIIAAPR